MKSLSPTGASHPSFLLIRHRSQVTPSNQNLLDKMGNGAQLAHPQGHLMLAAPAADCEGPKRVVGPGWLSPQIDSYRLPPAHHQRKLH